MSQHEHKATFWAQVTQGSIYVRCELPARHLPGRVLPFLYKDLFLKKDGTPVFPRQAGAAIWQYPGSTANAILIAAMQTRGIRCLVETDDNYILGAPKNSYYKSEWDEKIDMSQGDNFSYEAHRRIVEFADGVIVSTPNLADSYRLCNDNVYVCPNCVDPDDWPDPKPRDGIFRVGFAGSLSHVFDLNLTKLAFEWLSKQKDVELVFLGLHPRWPVKNAKLVGWSDSPAQYRENLVNARLDVGLCPILDTSDWAKGKSDVKALEYAMAGALPLVQDHPSFLPWSERCLIADSSEGFLEEVMWAYNNQDEVKKMAQEARAYALNERTIQDNVHHWEAAINGEGNHRQDDPGVPEGQSFRSWPERLDAGEMEFGEKVAKR